MKIDDKRMRLPIKVGMYLLSLWLLFLLVFVNKVSVEICLECDFATGSEWLKILGENVLPAICVALLACSFCCYLWFRRIISGAQEGPFLILTIEDKNSEHLVFLATYVVPLVGFGLDNVRQMVNLGITLTLLGALYVRTNLFYANPTLSLLGFRVFNVTFKSGAAILISDSVLEKDEAVNLLKLDRNVYFATKAIKAHREDDTRT